MTALGHKEMIESVEEYTRNHTLIKGYCNVVIDENATKSSSYKNYKVKDNFFWVVLGNSDDELINDIFNDSEFTENDGIEREGCYEYNAAVYYQSSTWEEPGESYIDYIDFTFIETFEAREREIKLNQLLDNDMF
jgi:hypothetical protein